MIPTATVEMQHDKDEAISDAATGDGPVDAVFKAMERIIGIEARLEDYDVQSISSGKDAQGEVLVEIDVMGRKYHGRAISTDIIEASARAYLHALNRVWSEREAALAQQEKANL